MQKLSPLILCSVLLSCSTAARREASLQDDIAQFWKGKTVTELQAQSYLSTLKKGQSEGKLTFTKDAQFNSKARCQAIGGCMGMFESGCRHIFFTQVDLVTGYASNGDCFSDMQWLLKSSKKQGG